MHVGEALRGGYIENLAFQTSTETEGEYRRCKRLVSRAWREERKEHTKADNKPPLWDLSSGP